VHTHVSSEEVSDAQRATLEFLLINHPLDCTVCDQAGHCKLQDYYYEYNSEPSRFIEEKNHKPKAVPLGPTVMYDGERCIVCTRCTRFCDEVPGTSELGVFNRGDKSLIGVVPGKELSNPFSGTVVDLCPVGALMHKEWRFNSRIWFAEAKESVCAGCSTGCNVNVLTRDQRIVNVKAKYNEAVNKEWLCDEGRYGFESFQLAPRGKEIEFREGSTVRQESWEAVYSFSEKLKGDNPIDAAIFISPLLTLEEIWMALQFAQHVMSIPTAISRMAIGTLPRELTEIERKLISPDRAPNLRAGQILGMIERSQIEWRSTLEEQYTALRSEVFKGSIKRLVLLGDLAIPTEDQTKELSQAIAMVPTSLACTSKGIEESMLSYPHHGARVIIPSKTVNEKYGTFVNKDGIPQKIRKLLDAPRGVLSEWEILRNISEKLGKQILPKEVVDDRSFSRYVVPRIPGI